MVVALGETDAEPEVPDAVKPVPVQDVACVALHERVADEPLTMLVGDTDRDAFGFGLASVAESVTEIVPTCFQSTFFQSDV